MHARMMIGGYARMHDDNDRHALMHHDDDNGHAYIHKHAHTTMATGGHVCTHNNDDNDRHACTMMTMMGEHTCTYDDDDDGHAGAHTHHDDTYTLNRVISTP